MPIGFHVIVRDRPSFREWLRPPTEFGLFNFAFLAIDVMAPFTQMIALGLFERYPRLKCAVLEAGANWISAWLDRLDHKHRPTALRSPLKLIPSEYFSRQCLVSAWRGMDARCHRGRDYRGLGGGDLRQEGR